MSSLEQRRKLNDRLRNPRFKDCTIRTTLRHYRFHGGPCFRAEVWFTMHVWHVVLHGPEKLLEAVGYKKPLRFTDGQAMLDLFEKVQEMADGFPDLLDDYDVIHEERKRKGLKQCNQAQGRGHEKY